MSRHVVETVETAKSGALKNSLASSDDASGLDVVIVTYCCRTLVRECLQALYANQPRRPMFVHVIDNASADGTVEMLQDSFPLVTITSAATNLGFSRATNIGIRAGSSPYILLLNPDTRVRPGVLDHLLAVLDDYSRVGIVSCRLEREDGTVDHAAARSFPTALGTLAHFTRVARRTAPIRSPHYLALSTKPRAVDMVSGAFMLIRREALEEVGAFDEGFWMYIEDMDLCYRFAQARWITWYDPTVSVTHLKGATSGSLRARRVDLSFHYGIYRFYKKHYAQQHSAPVKAALYAGLIAKYLISFARGEAKRLASSISRH